MREVFPEPGLDMQMSGVEKGALEVGRPGVSSAPPVSLGGSSYNISFITC